MPTQCPAFACPGYWLGQLLQAEFLGRRGIHIGIQHGLELADMEYVLDTIRRFLELHQS